MIPGLTTLVTSFGLVAVAAVATAAAASFLSRRPLAPAPAPQSFRWSSPDALLLIVGFFVVESFSLAFVVSPPVREALVPPPFVNDLSSGPDPATATAGLGGPPAADAAGRRERAVQVAGLWGRLFSATGYAAAFAGFVALRQTVRPRHRPAAGGTVRFAVVVWLVAAPVILAVNVFAGWAARQIDVTPDVHPLAVIGTNPNLTIVFLLSACVATPVVEELVVRGVLLPWAARGLIRSVVLFLPAALLTVIGSHGVRLGPVSFFGVLVLGFWALLHFGPSRAGTRARFAAVYATSVLFAAAHASVWPTPVPLFFFSLALGAVTLRTGGLGASILIHGLLNAVSATYVLRGGPM